jgi:hypothetical protein
MKFSNEMLMAYADGELDLVSHAEIEAAMAVDPEIARVIERHRALAARVQSAYQAVLAEPVPAQLASLAATPVTAPVVDLASRRAAEVAARAHRSPWRLPQWSALAASVALGAMLGVLLLRGEPLPYEETADGLIASGELDATLTRQLAGSLGTGKSQVGISFRHHDGAYCRTFHLQRQAPLAGLACRRGDAWKLEVLAAAQSYQGELRPAAAMPMAVLQAVDAAIEGEPFDAEAEAAARDSGWQATQGVAE